MFLKLQKYENLNNTIDRISRYIFVFSPRQKYDFELKISCTNCPKIVILPTT